MGVGDDESVVCDDEGCVCDDEGVGGGGDDERVVGDDGGRGVMMRSCTWSSGFSRVS